MEWAPPMAPGSRMIHQHGNETSKQADAIRLQLETLHVALGKAPSTPGVLGFLQVGDALAMGRREERF